MNTQAKDEAQSVGTEVAVVETKSEGKTESQCPALISQAPSMRTTATMQVMMTAPGRWKDGERNSLADNRLAAGAVDLYLQLSPTPDDAIESVLSMLAVSVTSASLDCLTQAASTPPDQLERRDINLRHGLKGAAVASELIKALDARRGNSVPRSVTVRDVNVEAGAQAVIGNVETPRRKPRPKPRGPEPVAGEEEPELEGDDG